MLEMHRLFTVLISVWGWLLYLPLDRHFIMLSDLSIDSCIFLTLGLNLYLESKP